MFDQTGQFLELFKPGLERVLAELAEREFVFVIANLFQHRVEMVLTRVYQIVFQGQERKDFT